mmetsp:Transcript_32316/g.67403  ORF Transcript_32316/g.67403 Transcript_32316/m.67403 type:complete len:81 (+) Transcript_32316:2206-2448(+)
MQFYQSSMFIRGDFSTLKVAIQISLGWVINQLLQEKKGCKYDSGLGRRMRRNLFYKMKTSTARASYLQVIFKRDLWDHCR